MRPLGHGAAAGALLIYLGCTAPACMDICGQSADVSGSVTDEAGAPVAGSVVAARWHYSECEREGGGLSVETDHEGRFHVRLTAPSIFGADCVVVAVEPPPGAALIGAVDTAFVRFSHEWFRRPRVQMDFTLAEVSSGPWQAVPSCCPLSRRAGPSHVLLER